VMDWASYLHGAVPFMLAANVKTDAKMNRVRIVESIVSAIVVGIISTAAAAWVTIKVVETQTAALAKADDERRSQVIGVLTQIATVQATLSAVVQQQSTFAREMHERVMSLERSDRAERNPRAR